MPNRYNLIDEAWIPVADEGRVSLRQIFSQSHYRALGGNPVQKIAVLKLLLAIAQAAYTPKDEADWQQLGVEGLAQHCLKYLDKWHDRFYLYGDRPFLQMPAIAQAELQSYGAVQPHIAAGNTTVLTQSQQEQDLGDADKALLLLTLMGFSLGGKKTDNKIVLTHGYADKSTTGKSGSAVAYMGLLHNFLLGSTLWQSLWLNLLTTQQIERSNRFEQGLGTAPWEQMPEGEACASAQQLKNSLMGRLIPLCRFCLLTESGLHYSEGLAHLDYNSGMADPSVAIDNSTKKPRALWTDPDKRPWRELTALVSFIAQQQGKGFACWQIQAGLERACTAVESFALWSAGLRVSSNAGEQYISGSDDFVESQVWLDGSVLNASWFSNLQQEMEALEANAKILYGCVMAYFKQQLVDGKALAAQATNTYWQLCEREFQNLIDHCDKGTENRTQRYKLRQRFASFVHQSYDQLCPNATARQMDAWANCRPNLSKYLAKPEETTHE